MIAYGDDFRWLPTTTIQSTATICINPHILPYSFFSKACDWKTTPFSLIFEAFPFLVSHFSQQHSAWADQVINHRAFKIYPVTSSHSDRKNIIIFFISRVSLLLYAGWYGMTISQVKADLTALSALWLRWRNPIGHFPQVSGSYRPIGFHACLHSYQPSTRLPVNTYLPQANQRRAQEVSRQLASHLKHQTHSSIKTQTPEARQLSLLVDKAVKNCHCSDPSNCQKFGWLNHK